MKKFKKRITMIIYVALIVLLLDIHNEKEVYSSESLKAEWHNSVMERLAVVSKRTEYDKKIQQDIYSANMIRMNRSVIEKQKKDELSEQNIYTFLQGPRSWSEGVVWSGEWCKETAGGNTFGGFGCGLCCMANIYSTLSGYVCSPLDMYGYAREASSYYPTGKSGAISWEDMNKTLQKSGFDCELRQKPGTYDEFRQQIQQMKSAIVLVSSYNDDTFWKATGGHYVNIWIYKNHADEVFLAEPGSPENNRTWIPLKYIYDALKTSSNYQYLAVLSYTEDKNIWKWDGIDEQWNSPNDFEKLNH